MHRTALFSRDRRFRYRLGRRWGDGAAVCFVLLNPSTADETREDPTVRRCIGFARSLAFRRPRVRASGPHLGAFMRPGWAAVEGTAGFCTGTGCLVKDMQARIIVLNHLPTFWRHRHG